MNSLCMASTSKALGDNNPALEPNVANYLTDQSQHLCLIPPRSFSPRSMLCAFPIVPSIMATATEAQVIRVLAPNASVFGGASVDRAATALTLSMSGAAISLRRPPTPAPASQAQ